MKSLRILLVAALAASLAFGAVGCKSEKNTAAVVNGEDIPIEQLNQQVEQLKKQYPQMFEGPDGEGRLIDFKQRLIDNMINQKLVEQAAKDMKIVISDADINKQIAQLKAGFKDDAQFQSALKSAGMSEAQLKQQIRDQLLTQKLIENLAKDTNISEAAMKAYYAKNKAQFEQKAAKRSVHILFKPEQKKLAEKVLADIEDGAEFAALAKKHSQDTASAGKGGDLGWPTTPYVPEFEAALAKLKKGDTSGLVKTPYGYHIIRVTDTRKGSTQKFSEVKEQIQQILVQQARAEAYQKFLEGLKKKAKIDILVEDLQTAKEKPAAPKK